MFDKVKAIIDEWDPIELLSIHCPPDEYDEISMQLSQMLVYHTSVEFMEEKIYNLFLQAFGKHTFDKTLEECRIIAKKIIDAINV